MLAPKVYVRLVPLSFLKCNGHLSHGLTRATATPRQGWEQERPVRSVTRIKMMRHRKYIVC